MKFHFTGVAYAYNTDAETGEVLGYALDNGDGFLLEDKFSDGFLKQTRPPFLELGKKYKVTIEEVIEW